MNESSIKLMGTSLWKIARTGIFLLLLLGVFLWPFVDTTIKSFWPGTDENRLRGTWVGTVNWRTGYPDQQPQAQGKAALMLRIEPPWFSFHGMTWRASITDEHGVRQEINISEPNNGWYLDWDGSPANPVTKGGANKLVGSWNRAFEGFQLTLRPQGNDMYHPVQFNLEGDLKRASVQKYNDLAAQLSHAGQR